MYARSARDHHTGARLSQPAHGFVMVVIGGHHDVDRTGQQGRDAFSPWMEVPGGRVVSSMVRAHHPAAELAVAGEHIGPEVRRNFYWLAGTIVIEGYVLLPQVERTGVGFWGGHLSTVARLSLGARPGIPSVHRHGGARLASAATPPRVRRGFVI